MKNFRFLSAFNSPFLRPKLKWYFGKVAVGIPYFLPKKRFGFDFVSLGWKTKWDPDDFRFEWNPMISFVFWKWQVVLSFVPDYAAEYWEAWLYYELRTDKSKSKKERIEQCRKEFDMTNTTYNGDQEHTIDFYNVILKEKYIL